MDHSGYGSWASITRRKLSYLPGGVDLALVPPAPRPVRRDGPPKGAGRPARPNPITTVQFTAQLLVIAEPRLSLALAVTSSCWKRSTTTGIRSSRLNFAGSRIAI